MPSRRYEGYGLVALEAGQQACPVIATRVGGLAEAVLHAQTGLLVEPEDPAALAQAMSMLLDDPGRAGQIGLAGRQRAQTQLDGNRFIDAYAKLYAKLCSLESNVSGDVGL
jgi:glycosyltransferase involved in cell wall biosynthesis